ncbi:MAG: response regulator [Desulfatiglandales bacterium]
MMGKTRVLLVDDEQGFLSIMRRRLQLRSLEVDTASDGEEALRAVRDTVFDVMILDLRMPGMDGLEVLRRVKEIAPKLPVIILTGHGDSEDEDLAYRLGCFQFLRKPVELDMILESILKARDNNNLL